MMRLGIEQVRTALSRKPVLAPDPNAAVALILRPSASTGGGHELEMLFIARAKCDRDRWSGNIAFPGGKLEKGESSFAAALREVHEEIGLQLSPEECVGQLDDVQMHSSYQPVSCFVMGLARPVSLQLNPEVDKVAWVPLSKLFFEPQLHHKATVEWGGKTFKAPAVDIMEDGPVLWGLTYRFAMQLLRLLDPKQHALLEAQAAQSRSAL